MQVLVRHLEATNIKDPCWTCFITILIFVCVSSYIWNNTPKRYDSVPAPCLLKVRVYSGSKAGRWWELMKSHCLAPVWNEFESLQPQEIQHVIYNHTSGWSCSCCAVADGLYSSCDFWYSLVYTAFCLAAVSCWLWMKDITWRINQLHPLPRLHFK